nr:hypothetical protein [Kibdelosporangium sp. MJ126-NF4]CEL18037.1 hypothetical protein [Kibdelosporangium sp. MJ126-NF4]
MTVGPDPATVATAVVQMAREGRFTDIEELFAPPLWETVAAGALRTGWESQIPKLGSIITLPPVRQRGGSRCGFGTADSRTGLAGPRLRCSWPA